ncbi:hypothetical protein BLOT_009755 [Blomia tropicalis]|nr:hypothetical protein BLOT_009755 [Blomia tropicalis]
MTLLTLFGLTFHGKADVHFSASIKELGHESKPNSVCRNNNNNNTNIAHDLFAATKQFQAHTQFGVLNRG